MDKLELVVDRLLRETAEKSKDMAATHFIRELRREIMLNPSLLETLGLESLGIVKVSEID